MRSRLFPLFKGLKLHQSIWAQTLRINPNAFVDGLLFLSWLLQFGEGKLQTVEKDLVRLPPSAKFWKIIHELIQSVFPRPQHNYYNKSWLDKCAILATLNGRLNMLIAAIISEIPGSWQELCNADTAQTADETELWCQIELLNSTSGTFSHTNHKLYLKTRYIFMFLRNHESNHSHVKRTRYIVESMTNNVFATNRYRKSQRKIPVLPLVACEPSYDDFPTP